MSRQTIGENPLDSLITTSEEPTGKTTRNKGFDSNDSKKLSNGPKQRLTVQISEKVVERAKNAVYWSRGLTLAQLTEQALAKALDKLEKSTAIFDDKTGRPLKEKNQPFPERAEELKTGRPIK